MSKGEVMALILLDLSAAFDTIDQATLTDRLPDWYGISGQAQICFSAGFDTIDQATLTDRLSDWYGISGQAQICEIGNNQ